LVKSTREKLLGEFCWFPIISKVLLWLQTPDEFLCKMEATLGARTANLITSFALMAIAMSCMLLQKKRVIAEQKQARRKKIGSVNIGGKGH